MTKKKQDTAATRRKFLGGAAVAGVATIAMPQVSRAQTVTLKMQSGFGPTDILSDYGRDYVAKVNEMGGGRLKIDFLNSGAVVKPFSVMDATSVGRARRQTGACRPTGTASIAPPRCSAPVPSTAPTPISTWAGSTTAAAMRSIAS